jgi:hypothetical protein
MSLFHHIWVPGSLIISSVSDPQCIIDQGLTAYKIFLDLYSNYRDSSLDRMPLFAGIKIFM